MSQPLSTLLALQSQHYFGLQWPKVWAHWGGGRGLWMALGGTIHDALFLCGSPPPLFCVQPTASFLRAALPAKEEKRWDERKPRPTRKPHHEPKPKYPSNPLGVTIYLIDTERGEKPEWVFSVSICTRFLVFGYTLFFNIPSICCRIMVNYRLFGEILIILRLE